MTHRFQESRLVLLLALPLAAALACAPAPGGGPGNRLDGSASGGDGGGARLDTGVAPGFDGPAASPANTKACGLLQNGPVLAVTGKAIFSYSDPGPLIQSQSAYRVTLPGNTSKVGHITFNVSTAGEFVLFANKTIPVAMFTWDGMPIPLKTSANRIDQCAQVLKREAFDLPADAKAYVIKLGPEPSGTVDVVMTAAP